MIGKVCGGTIDSHAGILAMSSDYKTGLMWFRRDLRVADNAALHAALRQCDQVHCVFVLDRDILDSLPRADRRVEFILGSLQQLHTALQALGGQAACGLIVRHASARTEIPDLARELKAEQVFAARDYEPQALARDAFVRSALDQMGIGLTTVKDQVIFEQREILTQSGTAYGVFTPYKNNWLSRLTPEDLTDHPLDGLGSRLAPVPQRLKGGVPALREIGFEPTNLPSLKIPIGLQGGQALFESFFERMDDYHATRDFPAVKGPSYLGVHLRFGTVSIRRLVDIAWRRQLAGSSGAAVWLSELVWRDFYFSILANFPHVAERAFKPAYDHIQWEQGPLADRLFAAWCAGQTGYPIIDAAMAQINQTGYMHNRLRMIAGSFLVKDLGIDWRWGERYFAQMLNDFDLSANNGGWQWVASSGCDAQPYFRIFNPVSQSIKFDPEGKFIRRYLPQLAKLSDKAIHAPWQAKAEELAAAGVRLGDNYPVPLVAHDEARKRTLKRYAVVKSSAEN